jgi:MSHA biogenesis protein MshP
MSRDRAAAVSQRGLGLVSVIVVLVALAALAAAAIRLVQQGNSVTAQDVDGELASAAARTGLEWGLYQAFKGGWSACSQASRTLDAGAGLRVTVRCDSRSFNEGESSPGTPRKLRVFTIDAIACKSTVACPDAAAATQSSYVERRRQVQAVD